VIRLNNHGKTKEKIRKKDIQEETGKMLLLLQLQIVSIYIPPN